jgi:hypothetical protein
LKQEVLNVIFPVITLSPSVSKGRTVHFAPVIPLGLV